MILRPRNRVRPRVHLPSRQSNTDSNGARILRFQPSQEDIDSAIEDYNPKIECVVNYFDDGDTLKLSAEGVLEGHRNGSNASFVRRTLVAREVRPDIVEGRFSSGI